MPPGYQGVVELDERILAFETSGRLELVKVKEGDTVKNGQLLAQLDGSLQRQVVETRKLEAEVQDSQVALVKAGSRSEDIRSMGARVRSALAQEKLLEKNLAREKKLVAGGASTPARVDEVETSLERALAERQSLEQQLKSLKRGARSQEVTVATGRADAADAAQKLEADRLDRFELESPIDGTVLDVNVEPGEFVQAGVPSVVVAETQRPYAEVFVPQDQLKGVVPGAVARVRVDATQQVFEGRVRHVARETEFTPRYLFSERERHNLVVRVKVDISDDKSALHAGVPVFVEIVPGARP